MDGSDETVIFGVTGFLFLIPLESLGGASPCTFLFGIQIVHESLEMLK